jgi:hypothetical protein
VPVRRHPSSNANRPTCPRRTSRTLDFQPDAGDRLLATILAIGSGSTTEWQLLARPSTDEWSKRRTTFAVVIVLRSNIIRSFDLDNDSCDTATGPDLLSSQLGSRNKLFFAFFHYYFSEEASSLLISCTCTVHVTMKLLKQCKILSGKEKPMNYLVWVSTDICLSAVHIPF